jgi:hypothetical protein
VAIAAPEPKTELQQPIIGEQRVVLQLQEGVYVEVEESPTFPQVPKDYLYSFLAQAREDEIEAVKQLRALF